MPRKPPAPPPHAEPRNVWAEAFRAELIRLRPHLQGADRLLATITTGALRQHGLESDPKAAAEAYHRDSG